MTTASIPVDLFNPGQVFACLGFLELAEQFFGNAEGGFVWSEDSVSRFKLKANYEGNPFEFLLDKLANATIREVEPMGWLGDHANGAVIGRCFPSQLADHFDKQNKKWTRTSLPISLTIPAEKCELSVTLSNWTDGSTRPLFKLYSGNRSAHSIASNMVRGKRTKPTKKDAEGKLEYKGLLQLWEENRTELIESPFEVCCSMGGSFNFDPRGGWAPLDAGYSPDKQSHGVSASPVVEILAVWGLEHARPDEFETRQVRYGVWQGLVPAILARAAIAGAEIIRPFRRFRFTLALSGKNKVVTFATEDILP